MENYRDLRIKNGIKAREVLAEYGKKEMDMPLFSKVEKGIVPYPPKLAKVILSMCNTTYKDIMVEDAKRDNMEVASADKEILSMIGVGRDNAVTYKSIIERTGMSKRKITEAMSRIRMCGIDVCNDQDGCGFYIGADLDDMLRNYRQVQNRGISTLKANKYRRRILKAAGLI